MGLGAESNRQRVEHRDWVALDVHEVRVLGFSIIGKRYRDR